MTDSLIECFGKFPKLAAHLHLPIQSGSDRILAAMKRNYTALEYKNIIKKLRKNCPTISISSDFIIGFPNETDADFNLTKKIMNEIQFDFSFSFLYSPRPGTPASYIHDEISHEIKLKRLNELQLMNDAQGKAISHLMLGSKQRILIDGVLLQCRRVNGIRFFLCLYLCQFLLLFVTQFGCVAHPAMLIRERFKKSFTGPES
jgi:tRNA-2-methylthio-N6-dimethylallyladenosine synthase